MTTAAVRWCRETADPGADYPASMTSSAAAGRSSTADVPELAGFGQRFTALLADWVLCLLLANGLIRLGWTAGPDFLWPSVVLVVEYALFLGFFSQTPGMRLAKVHCVMASGGAVLGLPRAAGRAVLLALFVPILTAFSDPHRRGLHDKLTGSAVIK